MVRAVLVLKVIRPSDVEVGGGFLWVRYFL